MPRAVIREVLEGATDAPPPGTLVHPCGGVSHLSLTDSGAPALYSPNLLEDVFSEIYTGLRTMASCLWWKRLRPD